MSLIYVVVEIIGAVLGYGMLLLVTPERLLNVEPGMCMTVPSPEIRTSKAFFIEFIMTFTLVLLVSAIWDPRNRDNGDSVPIRIGK